MEHLFKKWNKVKNQIQGRHLFVFLDFDGTLVPIARTPQKAVLNMMARRLLRKLSGNKKFKIALISGRAIRDIKSKIGLKNIIYSGNHGLEIEGPGISFKPVIPCGYRTALEGIRDDLKQEFSIIKGAFVEDKGLSLSLHYRLVNKTRVPEFKKICRRVMMPYLIKSKIMINPGKKILEIRPLLEWDKGRVVLWLLGRQAGARKNDGFFPIYIGDDVADEYAYKALGKTGLTVSVGKKKNSRARYYLKDPDEVLEFLERAYTELS